MKPQLLKSRLIVSCIAVLFFQLAAGQATDDYRTRASGNWNSAATWQRYSGTAWVNVTGTGSNTIPTSSDKEITILNTHKVTVTANATVDQVTIAPGGEIHVNTGKTLTIANGSGTDMIINGTLSNEGTITTTGSLSFGANAVYDHEKDDGTIPDASWNTTSTCLVSGVKNSVPDGLDQDFGNFTWNCTGQTASVNLTGELETVNGNFTVASTGHGGDVLRLTNGSDLTMNIGGDFIVSGGDLLFTDNNADVTINTSGNFVQSGGSIEFSDDNQIGVLTFNVNGNFSQNAGSIDFTSGGATVTRTPMVNLSGNFSQSGSATLTTTTSDDDIVNGTITFIKNGLQAISIATQSHLTYTNFIINGNSVLQLNSNLTLSSNSVDNWGGFLTVKSNGTLNAGTYQLLSSTGTGGGDNNGITLSAGATISTANVNGLQAGNSGTISTSLANRSFSSAANYVYTGSSPQNSGLFTTTPATNQVNNLTINNTGGTTGVTLQQTLSVAGTCYFTAGLITTSSPNLLIFKDNAIASGANNNVTNPSFVNGPVRKIGNDAFTFPVGKLNVGYMRCGISAPSNTSDAFTAEYKRNSATSLGTTMASGLYHVSACEYWTIDRTTGSSIVDVTLSWSGLNPCNGAAYVTSLSSLVVSHFNGSSWNAYGNNGGSTGNGAAGTVTWNNVSSFSPFTLGSTSATTNPLPVKFNNITAFRVAAGNRVGWTNLTEEDLQRYEVERSDNGISFNLNGTVSPKANDGQKQDYTITDEQAPAGTSFYRIKAIQSNGSYIYSAIVKVEPKTAVSRYTVVYPNPVVSGQFTVQLNNYVKGNYIVKLINSSGQQIINKPVQHPGGSISVSMEKTVQVRSGVYILQISGEDVNENRKLVIE